MDISIFLFVVFNINLVLTEDSRDLETNAAHTQHIHKVHSELKDNNSQNDQMADSSHSMSQTYTSGVFKNSQDDGRNQVQLNFGKSLNDGRDVYDGQNTQQIVQQTVHSSDVLSHNTVAVDNLEVMEPALTQGYPHQPQPIYVLNPLQPIRIFGSEASPLHQHQTHENEGQTLGYSSYVEHESQKDEEELKSALKEGSVSDIKRLVPKSGISFKIYRNDKNINLNSENSKTVLESSQIPEDYSQYSKLHHRIKTEIPVVELNSQHFQTVYEEQHPTTESEGLQQNYQQNRGQQHGFEDSQHLLPSVDAASHSQNQQNVEVNPQYFIQPELNSKKAILDINSKSLIKPHFTINMKDNNYNKATSTAEYNSLSTNRGSKLGLVDISNYQKQWNFDSNIEASQKEVKNLKPVTLQYEIDPVSLGERNKEHFKQTHDTGSHVGQTNFLKPKTKYFVEPQKNTGNLNYQSSSYTTKGNQNNFAEHLAKKAVTNLKSRLPGNYANSENINIGQNQIVSYLSSSGYGESQNHKNGQSESFATTPYPDSEPAKSNQHNLITHISKNSYIETKNSQNFDHQKALEGSTSFDIKNAIDSTGSLIHQTNHLGVTSETRSADDIQKQQLAYVAPKIPVLLDAAILEAPIVEGHQIKNIGTSSPQLSYHAVSSPEVSGKFFHQPQTIVWTSEYLRQGNPLHPKDLHQSLIKLHLPKEEFYQHVKAPKIELPTSSVSHVSYQQKQPHVIHYDVPFVKYPQEIHFQPKPKTRIQNQVNHLKLEQPVAIDWSLFKSTFPNFNVNSLVIKPELTPQIQETGKRIVPILIRKRKNRSNNKQELGMVVYGKINNKQRPTKPNNRQEKNVRVNLLQESSHNVKQLEPKGERKNEFSVSASYKVDRSFKTQ